MMTAHDYFARTQTIAILTTRKDGREVSTPIWAVLADGVPYIRSGYGEGSAWYRRLRRTWRAAFADGGSRYRARIEPVSDEPAKSLVDQAYKAKYRGQGTALGQAISPPARDYTMKVILDD
jgi:hypothetical protein